MPSPTLPPKPSTEFTGRRRDVTFGRMRAFSGGPLGAPKWPAANLHTDAETAKATGLDKPIGSAIQLEGYLSELILDTFGEAWLHGGVLSVKMIGAFCHGDQISAAIKVRSSEKDGDRNRYVLDVNCTRANDAKLLMVGEARLSA